MVLMQIKLYQLLSNLTLQMINRNKRASTESQQEQNLPESTTNAPSKFHRTTRRGMNTPDQTNVTSQISEPPTNQSSKVEEDVEKPKIIARTSRATRQISKSPVIQENKGSRLKRTTSPLQTPRGSVRASQETVKTQTRSRQMSQISSRMRSQQKVQQESDAKQRRSNSFAFIISRLLKKNIVQGFERLKLNKHYNRLKDLPQAKCLLLSVCHLTQTYEYGLYSFFFDKVKAHNGKDLKEETKSHLSMIKQNQDKASEYIGKVLNTIQISKLRQSFQKLIKKQKSMNVASKALQTILNGYQNRKMKTIFQSIKANSETKDIKQTILLNAIESAFKFCQQIQYTRVFESLLAFSVAQQRKQQQKPQGPIKTSRNVNQKAGSLQADTVQESDLSKKVSKLKSQNAKNVQEVTSTESVLKQKKEENQSQIKRLKEQVEELKSSKKTYQREVSDRKLTQQTIKKKTETKYQPGPSKDTQDDIKAEQNFSVLQKNYSQFSKMTDQQITAGLRCLLRQKTFDISQKNPILQEWALIDHRCSLQRQIDIYQSSILGSSSKSDNHNVLKLVRQENQMVRNLIKNFIKERYLWGEVQKYVSALL